MEENRKTITETCKVYHVNKCVLACSVIAAACIYKKYRTVKRERDVLLGAVATQHEIIKDLLNQEQTEK